MLNLNPIVWQTHFDDLLREARKEHLAQSVIKARKAQKSKKILVPRRETR